MKDSIINAIANLINKIASARYIMVILGLAGILALNYGLLGLLEKVIIAKNVEGINLIEKLLIITITTLGNMVGAATVLYFSRIDRSK